MPSRGAARTWVVGEQKLSFKPLPEEHLAGVHVVLVMLSYRGAFLLVFDRNRARWELPGGHVEATESPRQAALRELFEETGQAQENVKNLRCLGRVVFATLEGKRSYAGALFAGELKHMTLFTGNDEVAAITLYERGQKLALDPLNRVLLRLYRRPTDSQPPRAH